jgi:hypothetical protein
MWVMCFVTKITGDVSMWSTRRGVFVWLEIVDRNSHPLWYPWPMAGQSHIYFYVCPHFLAINFHSFITCLSIFFHDFPIVFPSQNSINIGCPHRNSHGNSATCPIQSSSSFGNVRQTELDRWTAHIYRRALFSSSELWTLLHDLGASKPRDGRWERLVGHRKIMGNYLLMDVF